MINVTTIGIDLAKTTVAIDPALEAACESPGGCSGRTERTVTVDFVSYEAIDGLMIESEFHRSPGDPRFDAAILFTKTVLNPAIDDALFSIAPERPESGGA